MAGVFLGLYGVFALAYNGDEGGGDTYVTIAGSDLDAHAVGGVSLAVGLIAIGTGIALLRARRA